MTRKALAVTAVTSARDNPLSSPHVTTAFRSGWMVGQPEVARVGCYNFRFGGYSDPTRRWDQRTSSSETRVIPSDPKRREREPRDLHLSLASLAQGTGIKCSRGGAEGKARSGKLVAAFPSPALCYPEWFTSGAQWRCVHAGTQSAKASSGPRSRDSS